ncbi:MAG TPA: hypothetical protein VMS21_10980 [Methylomirabilota bacterium]|nr:hypothetical protein [Methylomirabilota bacterium]
MKRTIHTFLWGLLAAICLQAAAVADDIPIRGVPVPELADFDDAVIQVMSDDDILGCTVGVLRNGCVVHRGPQQEAASESAVGRRQDRHQ